nr:succinate dehydrogenase assembly factor 4 [Neoroseomonas soli]
MAMTETINNDPPPAPKPEPKPEPPPKPKEIGGPSGPEPTRFGDWERKGRVSDF